MVGVNLLKIRLEMDQVAIDTDQQPAMNSWIPFDHFQSYFVGTHLVQESANFLSKIDILLDAWFQSGRQLFQPIDLVHGRFIPNSIENIVDSA
jgi:hypothetical protein